MIFKGARPDSRGGMPLAPMRNEYGTNAGQARNERGAKEERKRNECGSNPEQHRDEYGTHRPLQAMNASRSGQTVFLGNPAAVLHSKKPERFDRLRLGKASRRAAFARAMTIMASPSAGSVFLRCNALRLLTPYPLRLTALGFPNSGAVTMQTVGDAASPTSLRLRRPGLRHT